MTRASMPVCAQTAARPAARNAATPARTRATAGRARTIARRCLASTRQASGASPGCAICRMAVFRTGRIVRPPRATAARRISRCQRTAGVARRRARPLLRSARWRRAAATHARTGARLRPARAAAPCAWTRRTTSRTAARVALVALRARSAAQEHAAARACPVPGSLPSISAWSLRPSRSFLAIASRCTSDR